MKRFLDKDFLLETETAKRLFHEYAENMPIIDYHCHLNPKEIYEDMKYNNITEVWLGGDHYKWRQMRSNGVEEKYITGDASDKDKFIKWAETLEMAIGNPLYHWSHLELKKYFGYGGYLSSETAEEVWELCNDKLKNGDLSARKLIEVSNVDVICTTDDPVDSLEWHKKIKEDNFSVRVLPTWRPDKALHIEKDSFSDYLHTLSAVSGVEIKDFDSLIEALKIRMDFFVEKGCKVSDHGLEYIMYENYTDNEVNEILKKKLNGNQLSETEQRKFKTAFMVAMGKEYAKKNLVMQLHYGVIRDLNKRIFNALGADAGIDAVNNYSSSVETGRYLNALAEENLLPKTIIYPLNSSDFDAVGTIIGCFQDSDTIGKVQHGSGWWFNDNKTGMISQMTSLANLGLLGNFIGMLTDSRSFLSYTRHEYFRRIMCNLIGNLVENGEYPEDEKSLKKIVEGISYKNAKRYFGF
ncbi:glucuronate isomerase [Solobacterium sp.]|uniref:glucuronate isomerase n=1 Tax=Solobacterium sp. TaxID=2060878 RepID=UPI001CADF4F7|nr:glucuronate isomerase [Solobacterium sp.]MBF1099569.1 glucuronate isomerase [Solobacterium sp.]